MLKLKNTNKLVTFVKLMISTFVTFSILNIIVILIKYLFYKEGLHELTYTKLNAVLYISVLAPILMLSQHIHVGRAVRIDDKLEAREKLLGVMAKLKWKLIEETEDRLVFKAVWYFGIWGDKIIVKFIEKELYIMGPRTYVDAAIRSAKLPYKSYEIKIFE